MFSKKGRKIEKDINNHLLSVGKTVKSVLDQLVDVGVVVDAELLAYTVGDHSADGHATVAHHLPQAI